MHKILYFYPHKFSSLTDGIHTRVVTILEYFKSRGFSVDMIHYENAKVAGSYLLENQLIENLYLVSDSPFIEKPESATSKLSRQVGQKVNSIKNRFFPKRFKENMDKKIKNLPNLMTHSLTSKVLELSEINQYKAVLVTYSYWSDLLHAFKEKQAKVLKVIDPTDFLTLQQFYSDSSLSFSQIGNMFGDEIERMSSFDEIIHISNDELLLFSNFIPNKRHHFIPQFFKGPPSVDKTNIRYDVLLIASGNPYNIEGVNWFLETVYPLLGEQIRIAIAGNICNKISFQASNVVLLGFVDNIYELYQSSRFTICPLKRGSGMKIKVIESLSYGLPVVSTLKGVDGFINKKMEGGVMIADDPVKFAWHLMELTVNPEYYEIQQLKARELFEDNFSAEANFMKLDEIFLRN